MPQNNFDFLVVGSGIAGLTFALKVADHGRVGVITKKEITEANTSYAQGGIAGVFNTEQDSFEKHIDDTLTAGAGLCNREAVECIVRNAPRLIGELMEMGAEFTRKEGELQLGREGGHSENRIVHAADATGWEIERALVSNVRSHPNITVLEHHFALELLTEHHLGRHMTRRDPVTCFGAYVLDQQSGSVERMLSKVTVLASGGAGQAYLYSTNPPVATGDGIAMAYRAKAAIQNMEFVQFHPTALALPEADSFLISEAVRGYGGILRNMGGEAFMKQYDERAELAPRDIVARAIDDQLKKRGEKHVLLDVTHKDPDTTRRKFPTIHDACLSHGIDITETPIPVVPAAHYTCGGVATDLDGATTVDRLYACGETACTGVHGANRLASNSLLESLVFAERAAEAAIPKIGELELNEKLPPWDASGTVNNEEWILVSHNLQEVQQVMWDYVGIVRSDLRLERAMRRIDLLYREVEEFYHRTRVSVPLCELRNLVSVAYLIVRSALQRKESRGLHYTTDYPEQSEDLNSTVIG